MHALALRLGSCCRSFQLCILGALLAAGDKWWGDLGDMALRRFFPHYPTDPLTQALGRSYLAISSRAHRLRLRKARRVRSPKEIEWRVRVFWRVWQRWIVKNWPSWVADGSWQEAMDWTWEPPRVRHACNPECPEWARCVEDRGGPLPCEAVVVRDIMLVGVRESC